MEMFIVFLINLFFLGAQTYAAEIVSSEDATIQYVTSGKSEILSKGQSFSYPGTDSIFITSPGRVPLLMVPVDNSSGLIKISLAKTDDHQSYMNSNEMKNAVAMELNMYTIELFQLQKLMNSGRTAEARSEFNKLEQKYPGISAIDFIGASLAILEGNRDEAKSRLERGLKTTPDYEDAKNLLRSLGENNSRAKK